MLNKEKPVNIAIDEEKCSTCGICTDACPMEYLVLEDNSIKTNNDSWFGCAQCGNCMMTCPNDAVKVNGEGVTENDIVDLSNDLPDFNAINSLFLKRRSIRKYTNQEISQEIIEKVIDAASTAPMSIPPSEVKVLVINGADKVQELADELVKRFEKFCKIMNPFVLGLLKPIMGKNNYNFFKGFVIPLLKTICEERKKGNDTLFYNAPAVVLFYRTEVNTGSTDSVIAASFATVAAEAIGLGTCMIGSVGAGFDEKLKQKYGILKGEKPDLAFIMGYSDQKFNKGIKRKFNAVRYY